MSPQYRLVTLVSLSSIGAMAARFTVLLCAAQSGASPFMVGLLATAFAAAAAACAVPVGRTTDRAGTKRPLLFGTAILVVALALGAAWRDLPLLFVIAILGGLAHSTLIIAFQRLAGDLAPPNGRAEAFGLLAFGFSIAILAAPVISGFAIDHVGFSATFLLFVLIAVCSFMMVWFDLLPWPPAAGARHDRQPGPVPARSGTLGLLRAPALVRLWVCCAMFESAWMGFGFMVPIRGTDLGFSASSIGLIAGAAGVMIVMTRAFMTQLLRRFTPWQLLIAGLLFVALGFTGFALATQFAWLVACGALIGTGQGLASPMLNALIYEAAPAHEAGEAMALRTVINNVSQGSIPLIAGAVSSVLGLAPVFWLLAAGLFGTVWSSRAQWGRRRSGRRDGA